MILPPLFEQRMKEQLKEEYPSFLSTYEQPNVRAIRVNTLKISVEEFKKISPFSLQPVPWENNGFYVTEEKVGRFSEHFAGLYYSQEPSAMSVAPLLCASKNEKVLDLCAAPGGKSTQLAQSMQGEGLLVVNEIIPSRAKILSQNIERMGIKNAIVLNESPQTLSQKFIGYFDKILVDAPCSGEGMFKKNQEEALSNWSLENISLCAKRQKEILSYAQKMLKKGGKLVYSTCTFAPEEDEEQIKAFLLDYPQFTLLKQEKLYPHKIQGEGHFFALLEKTGEEDFYSIKEKKCICGKNEQNLWNAFEKESLKNYHATNLLQAGDFLYNLPNGIFDWTGLNVLRAGVRLGTIIHQRFEPSHSLAMALTFEQVKNAISLTENQAETYLQGEAFPAQIDNGWCLVCIGKYPLGWGKASNGIVKNHYPKALRKRTGFNKEDTNF